MIYATLPDIPTAVTANEAALLERFASLQRVIEVGSLLGFSTVVMAKVALQVWAVDPHAGYPEGNPRDTLLPFMANLGRYGVRERVKIIMEPVERFAPAVMPLFFGFGFVDITGYQSDTLSALMAIERLVQNQIAVHDFEHPDWPGVKLAVWDFCKRFGWTPTEQADRLVILERSR